MSGEVEDCKVEIRELKEGYRIVSEENEKLREVNEVQTKLWKVWLEKHEDENKEEERRVIRKRGDGMESVSSEDVYEERRFELRKNRGFKRRGERNGGKNIQDEGIREVRKRRRRFCHFWNNGRCRFRDSECRYVHEESLECRYGKQCKKCFFMHERKML